MRVICVVYDGSVVPRGNHGWVGKVGSSTDPALVVDGGENFRFARHLFSGPPDGFSDGLASYAASLAHQGNLSVALDDPGLVKRLLWRPQSAGVETQQGVGHHLVDFGVEWVLVVVPDAHRSRPIFFCLPTKELPEAAAQETLIQSVPLRDLQFLIDVIIYHYFTTIIDECKQ